MTYTMGAKMEKIPREFQRLFPIYKNGELCAFFGHRKHRDSDSPPRLFTLGNDGKPGAQSTPIIPDNEAADPAAWIIEQLNAGEYNSYVELD